MFELTAVLHPVGHINEARAVNRLAPPGLGQISGYGQLAVGTAYIVIESLADDTPAPQSKREGRWLPLADTLQLADSLAAAHAKGILAATEEKAKLSRTSPRASDGEGGL